jgi:hypothetical protein
MRYTPDYHGAEAWLRGPEAAVVALRKAEQLKAHAQAIAPVGVGEDEHPGLYRESIEIGAPYESHGRVAIPVVSTLPYATRVELDYGYHTLGRAADAVSDPTEAHPGIVRNFGAPRIREAGSGLNRRAGRRTRGRYTGGYLLRRLLPGSSPFKASFYTPTRPSLRRFLSPRGGYSLGAGVGGVGGLALLGGGAAGSAVSTYAGGAPPPATGTQPPPAGSPNDPRRLRTRRRRLYGQVGARQVAGLQGATRRRKV